VRSAAGILHPASDHGKVVNDHQKDHMGKFLVTVIVVVHRITKPTGGRRMEAMFTSTQTYVNELERLDSMRARLEMTINMRKATHHNIVRSGQMNVAEGLAVQIHIQ